MKVLAIVALVIVFFFGFLVSFAGGMSDNIPLGNKWGAAGTIIIAAAIAGIVAVAKFM